MAETSDLNSDLDRGHDARPTATGRDDDIKAILYDYGEGRLLRPGETIRMLVDLIRDAREQRDLARANYREIEYWHGRAVRYWERAEDRLTTLESEIQPSFGAPMLTSDGPLQHDGPACTCCPRRVAERDTLRDLLRAARSYIPRGPSVDDADLLAEIGRALGERG